MPTNTFFNLKPEKQNSIFDAAITEFSTRRYTDASINQIIKTAGISRGSFYQYFRDKEDLFLTVFQRVLQEKRAAVPQLTELDQENGVFELVHSTTLATYAWGHAHPQYNQLAALMEIDNCQFIQNLRRESLTELKSLIERDQERGRILPDLDSRIIAEILYSLLIKPYVWAAIDEVEFRKNLEQSIAIIKGGVSCL